MQETSPTFVTDRLLLGKVVREDKEFIFQGLSHPEIIKYYGVNYSTFEETEEQMIWYENLEKSGSGLWWSIRLKDNNAFCGAVGFNDYNETHQKAEIGFWLFPEFWGKGIIKESAERVIDFLFSEKQIHRIEAFVEAENQNSEKVLRKLGFRQEGIMKESERKNEKFIDIKIFALINQ